MSSSSDSCSSSSTSPWLLNACRSFTSLRARQVTGSHLLRIEGYSAAERMMQHGQGIESSTFSAGGHQWRLRFFPHGNKDGKSAAMELELVNHSRDDDVVAAYELSVLGRGGISALSYSIGPQRFNKGSEYKHRVRILATPEARQAALRVVEAHNDTLAVVCDLTITRFDKESRLKWYLRKLID